MTSFELPESSGVYLIRCVPTKKTYIGSSIDIRKRCYEHFRLLRRGKHVNPKLQHAFNKHGEDSFTCEAIELVLPLFLLEREQYWLDKVKPALNIAKSAQSAHLGLKHTPEALAKMSAAQLGKRPSAETREKLRASSLGNAYALGNTLSTETRAKMSAARMGNKINVGRKLSPEHREKIGAAQRGKKASPESVAKRRGRKHTPEAREKMSQAMLGNTNGLGKTPSPEKRQKISQAHLGRKHSPGQNEKQRQAMLGRTYSPEVYANRRKTFILTDPSGVEHIVDDLRKFCQEHNLNNSHLIQVAKGRVNHHKGWTARYV